MAFLRAMSKEFKENVIPKARREFEPAAHAVFGGRIIGTKFTVFNSRHEALRPPKAEWTRNHQYIAACFNAGSDRNSRVIRLWFVGVVNSPVDFVDQACLRRRSTRRHGEIGIATEVAQKSNLIVQTAETAVGAGVVECPKATNESKCNDPLVFSKQAMAGE